MTKKTRYPYRSLDATVPMHRRALDATQPMRPLRRMTSPKQRVRAILTALLLAAVALLAAATAVTGSACIFLEWAASQPPRTVLILGIDRRPGQGNVVRSDTLVLASFQPAAPHAALLSIPRDLYVDVPGYGSNRINTAHFWGENETAGGGPALAMQTVTYNFGVPVDHAIRVDFDGFRAVIDAVGGIDVYVEEAIVDDEYPTEDYGTIRIEIPAGLQHMDGETALQYARSRHGSSDFDRAARQQQILSALAERLLQPATWPRLPAVYLAVTSHVDTDMGLGDLLLCTITVLQTGPTGLEQRVIDQDMTQPWTTPSGGAVLLPRWELINPLVQELFFP
ncbi:MAG: LCP family protein [Anaerolineae bacterium]|nr:LCP family protein [Anaerolineae bacterium]